MKARRNKNPYQPPHPIDRMGMRRPGSRIWTWVAGILLSLPVSFLLKEWLTPVRSDPRYEGRLANCRYHLEQAHAFLMSRAGGGTFPDRGSLQPWLRDPSLRCSIAEAKDPHSRSGYTYTASELTFTARNQGRILLLRDDFGNHTLSRAQSASMYGGRTPERTDFIFALFGDGRIEKIYAQNEQDLRQICVRNGWFCRGD